jgi:Tfp pilus assembly protein PilV
MRVLNGTLSKLRQSLAAFSVVEVMVGAVVVGVMFVSVYSGISHSFLITQRSRENLRAIQVMTEKMELIRLYNWTQITTPGTVPVAFTNDFYPSGLGNGGVKYNGTVRFSAPPFNNSLTGALRQVTVELTWVSGGKTNRQLVHTLVASNGLQKYIY